MNVVILGAGPAGLCAAWNLVQDGHRVVVFEKESVYGGQSITFERNGFRYDLGPHNIHSRRRSVLDFLERHLGEEIVEHPMLSQIYFRGKRIDYPLLGMQVLQSLPPLTTLACGTSFLWRRVQSLFSPFFHDDGTYETWVVNRFGRQFYDIFFGPYTQKTWGFPPSELSDIVAKKRIAIRGLSELLKAVLLKQETYHPENARLIRNLYPRQGIGAISDFFAAGIRAHEGTIVTESVVDYVKLDRNRVVKIGYTKAGKPETLDFDMEGGAENWQVLSTIPINELALMLVGDVPQAIRDAAQALDFTAEIFLYLNLKLPNAFHVDLLYFSESDFPFNRIYDVGRFSRDMVPDGKNALCLEMTCSYGDAMWNLDAPTIFERCLYPLERHGLFRRDQISDYHLRRLPHAYPRFRVGYRQRLRTIYDYIATLPNFITFGREGLFSYANVDDVIWMAFEVVKTIPYRERITLPIEELLPDYIDF